MLTLVVEIILLRDQLTNSGTGLIWKVAYYGLPAAGIMLLAMLKGCISRSVSGSVRTRAVQDLSVFVAEVQVGTIVRPGDPNFALLEKATRTIQRFLDFGADTGVGSGEGSGVGAGVGDGGDEWAGGLGVDMWDFEAGFWQCLADHPFLGGIEPDLPSV
jgi:hypothetical protein